MHNILSRRHLLKPWQRSHIEILMKIINAVNRFIGKAVCWLALGAVLTQLTIVVMRYVFGYGSVLLQESVMYMHATLFMLGAAYTLLQDRHVRVDIFYQHATLRTRAWINLFGVMVFLWPFCAVIFYYAWPYVQASWAISEGSREVSGLHAVYVLKTLILIFALQIALQGLALICACGLTLTSCKTDKK